MPPTTVPARKSHSVRANRAASSAARQTSSNGSPAITLGRLGSRAEIAWLIAAVTKIKNDAAPIRAKLRTPSVPCRKAGTRLLNSPRT